MLVQTLSLMFVCCNAVVAGSFERQYHDAWGIKVKADIHNMQFPQHAYRINIETVVGVFFAGSDSVQQL